MNANVWVKFSPNSIREFFRARPSASLFASNSIWLLLEKLIRIIFALTVGSWVARVLGPHAFGELVYAITFIAIFQGIANLGADGLIVRDLARNSDQAPALLGTILGMRIAAAAACWAVAVGLAYLLRPNDIRGIQLIGTIGIALFFQSADTIDLWFQSQHQNRNTVFAKIFAYGFSNIARVALLLSGASLWAYAFANLLEAALLAAALVYIYRRHRLNRSWQLDTKVGIKLLRQSWPFMFSGLAVLLYMRIDQIMIRQMLGESSLGIYSAAVVLSQVWNVIPVALGAAIAPYIARKKNEGEQAYMNALLLVFRSFAAMALLISVSTALLAPWMVQLLYGPTYAASIPVLRVHIFSNICVFLGVAQSLWLINEGFGKITLYRTLIGAAISVTANFILIPIFGILGSAIAMVAAMFIADIASNLIFAPKIFNLQMRAIFNPFAPLRPI